MRKKVLSQAKRKREAREYTKKYHALRGPMSSEVHPERHPLNLDGDRPSCSHFGCARPLSLIESLAGNYCTKHMNHSKTDPVRVVKI